MIEILSRDKVGIFSRLDRCLRSLPHPDTHRTQNVHSVACQSQKKYPSHQPPSSPSSLLKHLTNKEIKALRGTGTCPKLPRAEGRPGISSWVCLTLEPVFFLLHCLTQWLSGPDRTPGELWKSQLPGQHPGGAWAPAFFENLCSLALWEAESLARVKVLEMT